MVDPSIQTVSEAVDDEGYFPVRGLFCKRNGVRGGEVGIAQQIT